MKILPAASAPIARAAPARPPSGIAKRVVEVAPTRTSVTRAELRGAIARAHEKLTGQAPSDRTLDVLTAQACLETGSGASMYNFNFGGIKGAGPSGATARCRTHEVIGGREVEIRDGFRAYGSLDEGAVDYVGLMRSRFSRATAAADTGDVHAFAHALKQAGYYTASEADYESGLLAQVGGSRAQAAAPLASRDLPSIDEWSRLIDSISTCTPADIAAPLEAEERGRGT